MPNMSENWVDGVRAGTQSGQASLATVWRCGVTLKMVDKRECSSLVLKTSLASKSKQIEVK